MVTVGCSVDTAVVDSFSVSGWVAEFAMRSDCKKYTVEGCVAPIGEIGVD